MPSALEPRLIEGPGQGLVRHVDPRHVLDTAWANGRNVRFPTGGSRVRKTDGWQIVDALDPAQPLRAIWWYVPPFGAPTLVNIGTTGGWMGVGAERVEIVKFPVNSVETPTIDDVITIDQYKQNLIWCDGKTTWRWTGPKDENESGIATPLGGGAPTARLVEVHKNHVLLGNLLGDDPQPWRVAYSAPFLPTNWTADEAGDLDFLDDASPITALKVLGDHAIVHKPNRLYRMIFVGPPEQYQTEGIPADDGSVSARSLLSVGAYQYYMGRTNVYRLASFAEPIGDRIWPDVMDAIDWARAHLIYAYRRLEHDEVCFKIPTLGAAQPALTVVHNVRDQTWTLTDHDPGLCFTEIPSDVEFPHTPFPGTPPPIRGLFGRVDGTIGMYGGRNAHTEPIHAWVESRHFNEGLLPAKILAVPCYATGDGTLQISCRAAMDPRHPMPAWPPSQPLVLNPSQTRPWVDVRQYGRLWQARFETTALDEDWEMTTYGAAMIAGGYAR